MTTMLDPIIANAMKNQPKHKGDFTAEDGLLHCGQCGEPRQSRIMLLGEERIVPVMCQCDKARKEEEEAAFRAQEIERHRRDAFSEPSRRSVTFELDDSPDSLPSRAANNYADRFDPHTSDSLLLHGGTGTGKSTLAVFIANAIIDKGCTVWFTSITEIERKLWETNDKTGVYSRIRNVDLLVLDDLGCERKSEYMNEIVFSVINTRYESGKPMVITTNLTAAQLLARTDLDSRRVMSRLVENAIPVPVEGADRRVEKLKQTGEQKLKKLLSPET